MKAIVSPSDTYAFLFESSIRFLPVILLEVTGSGGLEPISASSGKGGIHLKQAASSSQGKHVETNNHQHSRSHLQAF